MRTGLKSSAWLFDNKMVLSVFFFISSSAPLCEVRVIAKPEWKE